MAEQPMGHGVKQRDVIKMTDAEVDTGTLDPDAAAAAVIASWRARRR